MVQIRDHIDLNEVYSHLADPAAGGTCIFVGTVRDNSQGNEVTQLHFETYDAMAISEMGKNQGKGNGELGIDQSDYDTRGRRKENWRTGSCSW